MNGEKVMPSDVAAVFDRLSDRMCNLQLYWRLYRDLFGESAERVRVLNDTAPTFAHAIQAALTARGETP